MEYKPSIFSYTIKNYKILRELNIRKPYVWCGHIKEKLDVNYNPSLLMKFKRLGFTPIPMIESHYTAELDISKSYDKLIKTINQISNLSKELMIDIESQLEVYLPLYKTIRKEYPYHISACFEPGINKKIVKYIDRVTPMMYDYGQCIYRYEEKAKKTIREVLKLRKEFSLGIPIATTFHEFEVIKDKNRKIIGKNKRSVIDYAKKAFEVANEYKAFKSRYFRGIVWWGHMKEPLKRGEAYHYPYTISKQRAKEANELIRLCK